ncbi:MAG: YHS domain-containing (seleno)protein [Betaproteobacteria bacterium]
MRSRSIQLQNILLLAAFGVSVSFNTLAGEFNESDGVAIKGFDPVAYVIDQAATQGVADYTSSYKGSVFRFKNAANRDAFIANPEKFAPQYHGYCAFGVSRGYKAATSPDAFSVIDGKLYLNYNAEVKTMWGKDVPGYISKADAQWVTVEKTTKVVR